MPWCANCGSVHRSAASPSQVDLQPSTAPGSACTPRQDNSLTERRRQAEESCDVTAVLLESLNQGACPTVIEVREVRFDEWGRRRVRGRTSSGKSEDVLTGQELHAGEVYLMYSRTNHYGLIRCWRR